MSPSGGGGGGKTREALLREMELSLGYLEGAVSKGTLEMLPGTLNVLLENSLALQGLLGPLRPEALQTLASLSLHCDRLLLCSTTSKRRRRGGGHDEDLGALVGALRKALSGEESPPPPPLPPKTRMPTPPVDWFSNPLFVKGKKPLPHEQDRGSLEERPPPLPPKKRNVMSYMEIFGKSLFAGEVIRHDLNPSEELLYTVWQQNYHDYSSDYAAESLSTSGLFLSYPIPSVGSQASMGMPPPPEPPPPLLPPKKKSLLRNQAGGGGSFMEDGGLLSSSKNLRSSLKSSTEESSTSSSHLLTCSEDEVIRSSSSSSRGDEDGGGCRSGVDEDEDCFNHGHQPSSVCLTPSESMNGGGGGRSKGNATSSSRDSVSAGSFKTDDGSFENCSMASSCAVGCPWAPDSIAPEEEDPPSILDLLDASSSQEDVLFYNDNEVRAGTPDALILLATQSLKNDFLYQEAFLGTYRTFLSSGELLYKLMRRFRKLNRQEGSPKHLRAARSAFSLLVRVVDCLADWDFTDGEVMKLLTGFMSELVAEGELMLSKVLRSKFIQKYDAVRCKNLPELDKIPLLKSKNSKTSSILSFKSSELAESMTYLDYQLFLRLESVELILWVQEQNEDKSPNLTKFTEHFNNMSYWARTAVLRVGDPRERERVMSKFVKILKFLRKLNNFNSYLAILSALDSAPLRRLEWSRGITEALAEYCALIDSSSSFRAYRTALNAAGSPCIPYVGLILQDLTFVHIGNVETLENGRLINFAKRWQQFNILDNLRRFRKEPYSIPRNPEILSLFDDFRDYLSEDELWKLSEGFKARSGNAACKSSSS